MQEKIGVNIKYEIMERRQVSTGGFVTQKTAPYPYVPDSRTECYISGVSKIPLNYVPPPESMLLRKVPYKWPDDEGWSRSTFWNESN